MRATSTSTALDADDVAVQLLHGPIDSDRHRSSARPSRSRCRTATTARSTAPYVINAAGPYGVTVRVLPTHAALISPVELGLAAWAS